MQHDVVKSLTGNTGELSIADLQRSIPSMIDGLKPGQRKILFSAFQRKSTKEAKVAQFAGYVVHTSTYNHGETSLNRTIIGMAQDFVGSNNINLLQPNGHFGTRYLGGEDHGDVRDISTQLSPITRFLFREEDDILLDYLNEDGRSIEPTWYIPIIPMILVNGSEGIYPDIPKYNPRDIIDNVRRKLNFDWMVPMNPWYRGFKGTIEKTLNKDADITYIVNGIIEQVNETNLKIIELPVRHWIEDYKEFLMSNISGNEKFKDPFIEDYQMHYDGTAVHFDVILSEESMAMAKSEGLLKKFKLTTSISTSNMYLFDQKGAIKKYNNPEEIIEDFFHVRIQFYRKRKIALLKSIEQDLLKVVNKIRFILEVMSGEIVVINRKKEEFILELKKKGYASLPMEDREKTEDSTYAFDTNGLDGYDNYTLENVEKLCSERDKLAKMVEYYRKATPWDLWMRDLDALETMMNDEESQAMS